jgi:hypothetical protein
MKKLFLAIGSITLIVLCIYFYNYITLVQPVATVITKDSRNEGIVVDIHYKNYISTNTIIFNLKKLEKEKAVADVFRVLLQTSSALKNNKYDNIELAYKGESKFVLKGDYFKELGVQYEDQNPMYTMRTFPQNIYDINGTLAYSVWEGGMLGVLGKQMEDFQDFNNKWYLTEIIN